MPSPGIPNRLQYWQRRPPYLYIVALLLFVLLPLISPTIFKPAMSQKALLLEEFGRPLVLGSRPIPKPDEDQLLVKVLVAGLNPHDQRSRDAGLFVTDKPYVVSSDIVGEVVTVGAGEHSAKFSVGEQVFGHTHSEKGLASDHNAAQQYALVDARFVGKVAESGLTPDEASTIPVIVLVGFIALFGRSGHNFPAPYSPEAKAFDFANTTLLVVGAGSNTGRATVGLAKLAGIGEIIAVAGLRNEAALKSAGATHVIDRGAKDALDQIRAITGDNLVYAIDTVNAGDEQGLGLAALSNSKKGTLITYRLPGGEFSRDQIGDKSAGYDRRLVLGVSPTQPELTARFWEEVPKWLKEGKIQPSSFQIIQGLDADAVNKALDQYRDGRGVKTNIHPWE